MSNLNPLSSRFSQIANRVQQVKNTPYHRLKTHSDWQTQHIQAIEEQNHHLNNRIQELDQHSQYLQNHTNALEQQNTELQNTIQQLQHQLQQHSLGHAPAIFATSELEHKMLAQIHENTHFMQHLINDQQKTIQRYDKKVNTLQHSFSWQITGPLRASQKVVTGVAQVSQKIITPVVKAQAYVNQRPKLKDNLLRITGLKKLYSNKK